MKDQHISHSELLAAADGELDGARAAKVREHLVACWSCRTQMKTIEDTIAAFIHAHQESSQAPLADGPRALLRARLAELANQAPSSHDRFADFFLQGNRLAWVGGMMAALTAILVVVGIIQVSQQTYRLMPDPKLTPGAIASVSEADICPGGTQILERHVHVIPASVGREVFDRYGIERPKARAYELDYLIAPELGGADDPRNYWPEPYGISEWNAHVKDALEDRLHQLVCDKKLSLATAQHDIASNWIAAYKKYFRTDRPLQRQTGLPSSTPAPLRVAWNLSVDTATTY